MLLSHQGCVWVAVLSPVCDLRGSGTGYEEDRTRAGKQAIPGESAAADQEALVLLTCLFTT